MLEMQKSQAPGLSFTNLLKRVKTVRPEWEFSTKRAKRILRTQITIAAEDKASTVERKTKGKDVGAAVPKAANSGPSTLRAGPSGPLFIGKIAGGRPNLFWRAVSTSDLREHPLFEAL